MGEHLCFFEDLFVKPEEEGWDVLTNDVRNGIINGVSNYFERRPAIAGVIVPLNRQSPGMSCLVVLEEEC